MGDRPAAGPAGEPAGIRTFLIADVRGYTLFTQERGDEAAAKLAARFAEIAREDSMRDEVRPWRQARSSLQLRIDGIDGRVGETAERYGLAIDPGGRLPWVLVLPDANNMPASLLE